MHRRKLLGEEELAVVTAEVTAAATAAVTAAVAAAAAAAAAANDAAQMGVGGQLSQFNRRSTVALLITQRC